MIIEELSEKNISALIEMVIKLWSDCDYNEEYENYLQIMNFENQKVFIARVSNRYVGFIQLSIRTDYVEGTTSSQVLYIEGLYVESIQKKGDSF